MLTRLQNGSMLQGRTEQVNGEAVRVDRVLLRVGRESQRPSFVRFRPYLGHAQALA